MPPRAAEVDAQQLCLYFSKRMHMHALAPAPHHKKKNWRTWMPSSSAAPCAYPVTSMRLTTPLVTLMVSPPMG